jgi:hypothetical protein
MWPIFFATDQSSAFVEASLGTNSKANTSKGWKQIDCGIKRIGCASAAYPKQIRQRDGNESTAVSSVSAAYPTVRSGSTRQTDRLRSDYDCRFSSLEACNGPVATTVASSTATGRQWGQHRLQGSWKQLETVVNRS